jgi:HPt (histidine-containing phosphotransfer) domain-containing protein
LPIIAMTAHATSEERDACLRSGMQDHIAKPIDPDQFYQTLSRWLKPKEILSNDTSAQRSNDISESPEGGDHPSVAVANDQPDSPIEIPGFDTMGTLDRIGGSVKVYHRILEMMLPNLAKSLTQFDAAIENNQPTPIQHVVHSIRGMSANVGATTLANAAATLEHALIDGNADARQLSAFRTTIEDTLRTMERSLAGKVLS